MIEHNDEGSSIENKIIQEQTPFLGVGLGGKGHAGEFLSRRGIQGEFLREPRLVRFVKSFD